ncbi:MAG: hypothetical protein QMC89_04445 [Candidatus Hodarchaeaceae archaeon]|nr:hypothetical protein [Candidatus Hodarchaeaceae archaeon]
MEEVTDMIRATLADRGGVNGQPHEVVLGAGDFNDALAEIGKDRLFWPAALSFDGNYLWVGGFKLSERIPRFSPLSNGHFSRGVSSRI